MKVIALLRRKEGMSFEDFASYLLNDHVPFIRAIPGLQRWTANLAVPGDETAPYDAITEFWFEDEDTFTRAMASEEVAAALHHGEKFVAAPGPMIIVADEHNVIE